MKTTKHIILALGCNTHHDSQMTKAKEILTAHFPDIVFTDFTVSAAYGPASGQEPYANMMAACSTLLSQEKLVELLKSIETESGNTTSLRAQGIVMMDIDLMKYDNLRCHINDWERPYIKKLYSLLTRMLCIILLLLNCAAMHPQIQESTRGNDSELLSKAVEYYIGGKYHESTLMLEKLKRTYSLSPRLLAYLGFSYYKEGKCQEAAECLSEAIPHLSAFSPKEQSVYIYACAESLFQLEDYRAAATYYKTLIPLTDGNDKGDVLFHKAFANYIENDIEQQASRHSLSDSVSMAATECYHDFKEAIKLYKDNTSTATPLQTARLRQCEIITKGFEENIIPFIRKKDTLLH